MALKSKNTKNQNKKHQLKLLVGADEALTLRGVVQKQGRLIQEKDLGLIKKPVLLKNNQEILFVGTLKEFNSYYKNNKINLNEKSNSRLKLNTKPKKNLTQNIEIIEENVSGTLMPGFVESHTHLVFAGDRRHEFELRNQGASYQDIANQGGGIKFTMEQTLKTTKIDLLKLAQARVNEFKKQGVVLLESKSGYGSDLKTELKILEINDQLKGLKIVSTFLGLHAILAKDSKNKNPKDLKSIYVHDVLNKYLPEVHKKTKARHADIFLDQGYFDESDLKALVLAIKKLDWTFTAHTDQLAATGSGLSAANLGAKSISHCVNMSDDEIQKVAQTNTVFNLLPTADFYLKIKYPKARKMIESGGRVSLATDFNPGSSPTQNLNFVGVLARLEMKMSLPEVIAAYTYNAAAGLGFETKFGALASGYTPNIQILNSSWKDLFYQI